MKKSSLFLGCCSPTPHTFASAGTVFESFKTILRKTIFLSAIWLPHGQLWVSIEGAASFTWCWSLHLICLGPNVLSFGKYFFKVSNNLIPWTLFLFPYFWLWTGIFSQGWISHQILVSNAICFFHLVTQEPKQHHQSLYAKFGVM